MLRSLLADVRAIDEQAARERAAHAGYDRRPAIALLTATVCLAFMEYAGLPSVLFRTLATLDAWWPAGPFGATGIGGSRWLGLVELGYWVSIRVLGFFVVPALVVRFAFRERLAKHGLARGTVGKHAGAYALLFALVLPAILLAAQRPEFVRYYPFYKRAHESVLDLVCWELLYASHFWALEFFFRGFMLSTCRRAFGSHALFVMVVPYCMIHFTKPLLEVLGAIPAGLVLGVLALRSGSIWGGVVVHVAVAVTMDVLALLEGPGLPMRWWP